jgi:hypothetical protein
MTDGRAYFRKWAAAYRIEGLDPDAVSEKPLPANLKRGAAESKLGGRITRDLKRLERQETERRRELSEEFLKRPARHFAADEHADS